METINNTQSRLNLRIFTVKDIEAFVKNRRILIYGAGRKGIGFCRSLERNGFKVYGFIDKSPLIAEKGIMQKPCFSAADYFSNIHKKENDYIFTAAVTHRSSKELNNICHEAGLENEHDFIDANIISPLYPSVDISGVCNLKCIACPRGDTLHSLHKGGFMSAAVYQKILNKLLQEIPFLSSIELFIWGEPLLNPHLPEILEINNKFGVDSSLSTNLNYSKNLEASVKAGFSNMLIACSGYGKENYEVTHTGADWNVFYNNLLLLSEYIKKYNSPLVPVIFYFVTKKNIAEYKDIYELCKKLKFRLFISPYLLFADYILDYAEGNEICPAAKKASDLMLVHPNKWLELMRKEQNKRCFNYRAFPNIGWDGAVYACCNISRGGGGGLHRTIWTYLWMNLLSAEIIRLYARIVLNILYTGMNTVYSRNMRLS
ncbi:MAG: hypothetical protein LBC27_06660 [Spirochaetaceae bacterium]|nr:hypothetical protein [Spirochaetaceae bacterium]